MSVSKSKSKSKSKSIQDIAKNHNKKDDGFLSIFEDIRSKRDNYELRLEGINICKPWYLSLNDNCTMKQVETIINYHLGFDMNTIKYKGNYKINQNYKIIIGDENKYDLKSNIFVIDTKTTFIKYWNNIYSMINYNHKIPNKLIIDNINIEFQRTLRLPPNDYKSQDMEENFDLSVPPSLGTFSLKNLSELKDIKIKTKYDRDKDEIFIIGMHQCEAMWFLFDVNRDEKCSNSSAVKLALNGINLINGQEFKSKYLTRNKQQNYIIVNNGQYSQKWIDGINDGNDNIQQIVAPKNVENNDIDIKDNDDNIVDIDNLCGLCLEIEVFNKLNENIYVSYQENDYCFLQKNNKNDNNLLFMKPEQLSLNKDDNIYFYSSDIEQMKEITINDARNLSDSGEILFYHSQKHNDDKYKNIENDYIKWIRNGAYLF